MIKSGKVNNDIENLVELSLVNDRFNLIKDMEVALISDNEDMKKLNYYLFGDIKNINYYTLDENIVTNEIDYLDKMDIVVFNHNDENLKDKILHNIKAKGLNCKFFVISNKSYLRQKDILKEHINGVDKLLKMDFFLEDYVLSMERYLRNNFYSKRILDLEDESENVTLNGRYFQQKIEKLLDKKIFFSLFKYKYSSEMSITNYNIKKIVRELDLIYIDKNSSEITFLILNVIPQFGSLMIKNRISNFSIILEELEKTSAFELIYEN